MVQKLTQKFATVGLLLCMFYTCKTSFIDRLEVTTNLLEKDNISAENYRFFSLKRFPRSRFS